MTRPHHPPLWNLAANPIFKRHAVSRLRPLPVIFGLFLVQVIGGTLWAVGVLAETGIRMGRQDVQVESGDNTIALTVGGGARGQDLGDSIMAYAAPTSYTIGWAGILLLQAVLALSKGSFSTAVGVARESNEGMIDAQYLTPLPTGHKVLGQLSGYPLYDNLLAVSLLPWAVASGILGGFSALMMVKVYLLFAISVVFYQSVSLSVGTLVRQKILAATLSQILVLSLAILPPLLGSTGVGIVSYLSMVNPILDEITFDPSIYHSFLSNFPSVVETERDKPAVHFFRWIIGMSGYHWLVMLGCVATSVVVLWRRWNDHASQLLGKPLTAFAALLFCFMTLGELLPRFSHDLALPGWASATAAAVVSVHPAAIGIPGLSGICWIAGLALGLAVTSLLFVSTLVPSPSARTRSRLMQSPPWWLDGREALPWALGISLLFGAVWCIAAQSMARGVNFAASKSPSLIDTAVMLLSFAIPVFTWYALVVWRGWKQACFAAFTLWLIPLLVAIVAQLYWVDPGRWVMALTTLSAPAAPVHAAFHAFGAPQSLFVKISVFTSLAVHAFAAALIFLHTVRGRLAESVPGASGPFPDPVAARRG